MVIESKPARCSQKFRKVFPFFKLPAEVRKVIYDYCLVVDNVYPYLEPHRLELETDAAHLDAYYFDAPNVSLLKTCKRISWEAEHLLYQHNTFVMPTSSLTAKFFANTMTTTVRRSWMKSIEVYLDPSDLDTADRKVVCGSQLDWPRQLEQALRLDGNAPPASHLLRTCGKELHRANKTYLVEISWPRKMAPILEHLQLDTLVLNIDCSKCEDDCCTLYAGAVMAFHEGFALGMPKDLKIYGLPDLVAEDYFDPEDDPEEITRATIEQWSQDRRADLEAPLNPMGDPTNGDVWRDDMEWELEQVGKWRP